MAAATALPIAGAASSQAQHPDAELIRLCAEFNARQRLISAAYDGPGEIADDKERDAYIDPISDEQRELLDRITEIRATTLLGLFARIETVALYNPHAIECPQGWDEEMFAAVVRDGMLLRAGGPV